MNAPRVTAIQRFAKGASDSVRRDWGRKLIALLDSMGIGPEEHVLLAHPSVMDGPGQLEDLDADIARRAGASDPDTSREAARRRWPSRGQRREIVNAVREAPDGLTCEEAAITTGIRYDSASPRVSELKEGGWLEARGTRATSAGSPAEVLYLTAAALERLATVAAEVGDARGVAKQAEA